MLRAVVSSRNKEICLIRKITGTQTYLSKAKQPKENPEQKCYIIKTRSEKHNKKEILYETDLIKAAKKKECLQNAQEAKRKDCPNAIEKLMQKVKEMIKFQQLEQQFSEKYQIILKKQILAQEKLQNILNSISLKQQLPNKKELPSKIFETHHNHFVEVKAIAERPKTIPELALQKWELITNTYERKVLELKGMNWELIRLSYQKEALLITTKYWELTKIYYQQNVLTMASRYWEIVKTTSKSKATEVTHKNMKVIKTTFKNTPEIAAKGLEVMKQVPFLIIEKSKIALIYADAYYQIFMLSKFKSEMVKFIVLTYDSSKKATIKVLIFTREAINAYIEKNAPKNLLKKK